MEPLRPAEAAEAMQALLREIAAWLMANRDALLGAFAVLAALAAAAILLRFVQGKLVCRGGRLYQIAVPQGAEVQPFAAEQMFAALHGLQERVFWRLLHGFEHVSLEIAADATGIRFYLWCPARIADAVVRLVHSAYEQADIRPVERDYLAGPGTDALGLPHRFPNAWKARMAGARMHLARDIAFPLKTLREFEKTDPLAGLTAAMEGLSEGEGMVAQLLIQPGGERELRARARTLIRRIEQKRSIPQPAPDGKRILKVFRDHTPEEQQQVKAIGGKQAKLPFRICLRLAAFAPTYRAAYARLRSLAAAYGQFNVATLNAWQRRNVWFFPRLLFLRRIRERAFPLWGTKKLHHPLVGEHDVLCIEELASLWHLPHPEVVETPGIVWSLSRKRAVQAGGGDAGGADGLVLARTVYRGEKRDVRLPVRALFTHVGIVGLPGSGKTTLLAHLALQCIERSIAVVLLDPHGDLCDKLLPLIPPDCRERVIYFNPADTERPMGLNFLEPEPGQHPAQVKSEVLTMLLHLFGTQMIGPRSQDLLQTCLLTLQEIGGMTLLEVRSLLQDERFRDAALLRVRSMEVLSSWNFYLDMMRSNKRLYLEATSPVLNKIRAFATDPRVGRVVGQARSSFRLREVLDGGTALLCNLSQGELGMDNSRLLGGAVASRVIQAAMARAGIPEEKRRPAVLIADEFHVYVGPAFPQALAQVRKYRLGLVLACQNLAQLEELPGMRTAFLSAGTLCVFKCAAEDGSTLSREFTGFFEAADLVRLDPHQVAVRVAQEHETIPFSGETIPLEEAAAPDPAGAEEIRRSSREKYGRRAEEVEAEIARRSRFYEETPEATVEAAPEAPAQAQVRVYRVPEV